MATKENFPELPLLSKVITAKEYGELRSQVDLLRQEYKIAKAESGTAHKLEALVAKQQQEAGSLKEAELQAQLDKASAGLRDQLERSARARKVFEREKKALQTHADDLAVQLEQLQAKHVAELTAVRQSTQQELQQAQHEARQQCLMLEAQQAEAKLEADHHLAEAAQQHSKELAEVQSQAAQKLEAAAAAHAALRQQYDRAEVALERAVGELQRARAQAARLQAEGARLAQRVAELEAVAQRKEMDSQVAAGDLEGRVAQLEAQLGQQEAAHAAELRQVKERHAEELDNVQARFKQVLGRKAEVVEGLREQLSATTAQLRQMEDLLAG